MDWIRWLAKSPWTTLFGLAWPIVLTRATQAVIGFADALMVAPLGQSALAAVTTGALDVLSFSMLPMGTVFIVQSFTSQLRGKNDLVSAGRYAWYGLLFAVGAGAFAALFVPFVPNLVHALGYEVSVELAMSDYCQARLWGVGAAIGTEALGNFYGGLGNTRLPLVFGVLTMAANVFLNYLWIEPRFGLPGFGVVGAGWASTLASIFGFLGLFLCWASGAGHRAGRGASGLTWRELLVMLRFGLPSGFNYFLEFAAFVVFINAVVGHLGTSVLAAFNIVLQWSSIAFMPAFGLASAGAILVGEAIGAGKQNSVPRLVAMTLTPAASWMVGVGLLYVFAPGFFFGFFASEATAGTLLEVGQVMLGLSGLWQLFDATAMVLGEALRAAGDTLWPMLIRLGLAWGVFLPGSAYAVFGLGGQARAIMTAVIVYLFAVATLLTLRFLSGAWRSVEMTRSD